MRKSKYPESLKDQREFTRLNKRIDILKRSLPHQSAPSAHFSQLEYHLEHGSTLVRNVPKKPSRQAIRKNSRRARAYARYTDELAARVA